MNYHYIDYMIRERRREELEECERRRLLKSSGTSQTDWIPWARRIFSNAVERLKEIRPARPARMRACVSMTYNEMHRKGGDGEVA